MPEMQPSLKLELQELLLVGFGAVPGALLRWQVALHLGDQNLLVNVLGAALLGLGLFNAVATPPASPAPQPVIVMPAAPAPAAATATYTVQRGDSLASIAAAHNTNYLELARMNNLINPDVLYVGQVLNVPGAPPPPAPSSDPAPPQPGAPPPASTAPPGGF